MLFRFLATKKSAVLIYGKFDHELAEGLSYDYERVMIVSDMLDFPSNIYIYDVKTKNLVKNESVNLKFDLIVIVDDIYLSIRDIYCNANKLFLALAVYMHSDSQLAIITNNFYVKVISSFFRPTLNFYKKKLMSAGLKCEQLYSITYENKLPVEISLLLPEAQNQLIVSSEPEMGIKQKFFSLVRIDGCFFQNHLMVVTKC